MLSHGQPGTVEVTDRNRQHPAADGRRPHAPARRQYLDRAVPADRYDIHVERITGGTHDDPVAIDPDDAPHLQAVRRDRHAVDDQPVGPAPVLDGDERAVPPARSPGHRFNPVVTDNPVHLVRRAAYRIDFEDGERALVARLHHEGRRRTLPPLHVRQILELPAPTPVDVDHAAIEGNDAESHICVCRTGGRIPDRLRLRPRLDGRGDPPLVHG